MLYSLLIHIYVILTINSNSGKSECPCISPNVDLKFTYDSQNYTYDKTLLGVCGTHYYRKPWCKDINDQDLDPLPGFCNKSWCFVNTNNCDQNDVTLSNLFVNDEMYYSYKTCGDEYNFNPFITNVQKTSIELMTIVDNYVYKFRNKYVDSLKETSENCTTTSSCNFDFSVSNGEWISVIDGSKYKVNYNYVNYHSPHADTNKDEYKKWTCEANAFENEYKKVSRTEFKETDNRKSNMYTGWADNGNYVSWPVYDKCFTTYDPRYRPWFANAATGPKDIIIMLDTSGSMHKEDRINKAKNAAKKVLDTLTEFDHSTLINFSSQAEAWDMTLRPMTPENKLSLNEHIENLMATGGTNFEDSFDLANSIFKNSNEIGKNSSGCLKSILFLTDGESTLNIENVQKSSKELGYIVFAYSIGNEADSSLLHEVACKTGGVAYNVSDTDSNLSNIMASYYHYFASGIRDTKARWLSYPDITTSETLYTSCVPLYEHETNFKGVTCMDMNVILDNATLEAKSDFQDVFLPKLKDANKVCAKFDFKAQGINIDDVRERMGGLRCEEYSNNNIYLIIVIIVVVIVIVIVIVYVIFSLTCLIKSNSNLNVGTEIKLKNKDGGVDV